MSDTDVFSPAAIAVSKATPAFKVTQREIPPAPVASPPTVADILAAGAGLPGCTNVVTATESPMAQYYAMQNARRMQELQMQQLGMGIFSPHILHHTSSCSGVTYSAPRGALTAQFYGGGTFP